MKEHKYKAKTKCRDYIRGKSIEGYLDSISSLTFNTIKIKLNILYMQFIAPDISNQNIYLI